MNAVQDPLAYQDDLSLDLHPWSRLAKGDPRTGHETPETAPNHPVLVVDDDWAIRESLRLMLEDEGYAVTEARDGVEALDAIRVAADPRVVLLDLMMPRMSGEEVLADVLRDPQLHMRVAFIVISADPGRITPALRRQLAALSVPILGKPLEIDDVLAQVASAEQRLPRAM